MKYECELPRAEARWLAGEHGPLAHGLRGAITWNGHGAITLDQAAFDSLTHLGTHGRPVDGRVIYEGDQACIAFDPAAFPVYPVAGPGDGPHGGRVAARGSLDGRKHAAPPAVA